MEADLDYSSSGDKSTTTGKAGNDVCHMAANRRSLYDQTPR